MKIVFIVFAVLFLVAEVAVCLIKRTVSEKVSGGQAQYDKYKDSLLAKVFASEKLSSGSLIPARFCFCSEKRRFFLRLDLLSLYV